ncbi:hypothetical protein QS306_01965 [Paraburkholderia bonniea]|uniref:hypothetical protein n=1 Tax=Paraburkholderia bonniea TaxID=2152891 RepID=UPI0025736D98|nr:hypothetical protein [Paraburkholderia bonniea]WJF90472.1 hypothetical protein QS306_01965 [Paraburkholderia bonniea]WJF93787.1 hypothetical protein QS308_01965 [Paraburkholderia bonniea]
MGNKVSLNSGRISPGLNVDSSGGLNPNAGLTPTASKLIESYSLPDILLVDPQIALLKNGLSEEPSALSNDAAAVMPKSGKKVAFAPNVNSLRIPARSELEPSGLFSGERIEIVSDLSEEKRINVAAARKNKMRSKNNIPELDKASLDRAGYPEMLLNKNESFRLVWYQNLDKIIADYPKIKVNLTKWFKSGLTAKDFVQIFLTHPGSGVASGILIIEGDIGLFVNESNHCMFKENKFDSIFIKNKIDDKNEVVRNYELLKLRNLKKVEHEVDKSHRNFEFFEALGKNATAITEVDLNFSFAAGAGDIEKVSSALSKMKALEKLILNFRVGKFEDLEWRYNFRPAFVALKELYIKLGDGGSGSSSMLGTMLEQIQNSAIMMLKINTHQSLPEKFDGAALSKVEYLEVTSRHTDYLYFMKPALKCQSIRVLRIDNIYIEGEENTAAPNFAGVGEEALSAEVNAGLFDKAPRGRRKIWREGRFNDALASLAPASDRTSMSADEVMKKWPVPKSLEAVLSNRNIVLTRENGPVLIITTAWKSRHLTRPIQATI